MAPAFDRFPFLSLPGEVRNRIYRYALVETTNILVTAPGLVEPALMATCKVIRKEAGSIYYGENVFRLDMMQYSPAALRFSRKIDRRLATDFNVKGFQTACTFRLGRRFHWQDLLQWLHACHSRSVDFEVAAPTTEKCSSMKLEMKVIGRMFATVKAMLDQPWPKVEALMKEDREILATIKPGWKD